ncbi:MAG: hypothetical protein OXS29_02505 [bacterium]|nr:hypothetical protein [bacterium]MDE0287965.1 hypothetical protein [bacterium]MDE0438177.1 hypothetical protein [bacterium]
MVGIGYVGDLDTVREFVADYGVTFTMLWSESSRPTTYYFRAGNWSSWRWSTFWLLDPSGDRVVGGLYENGDQIEELLAGLE